MNRKPSESNEAIATAWIDWAIKTNRETGNLRDQADQDRAREAGEDWAAGRLIDMNFTDPQRALKIAIDIATRSNDQWVLCLLGCGPFEDALATMGRPALEILKNEAEKNDDIFYALEHTWQNAMPDELWRELQYLLGRNGVAPREESPP